MRYLLVITLILAVAGILYSQPVVPDSRLDTVFKDAEQAYSLDQLDQAFELFSSCYLADTTRAKCLEGIARTSLKIGDYKKAKESYHKLEKVDLFQGMAHRRLAGIYETEENVPKAVKYYTILNQKDTTNAFYWRKLGQLYQKAGLVQESFVYYSRAYHLNSLDNFAIRGLAEILIGNKQYDLSDSILLVARNYDSTNVQLNLLYARSLYQRKEYAKTVDILSPVSLQTGLSNYYAKMLGYAYLQIDSVEQSIFYLFQSLNNESDPEYAEYYLAVAHERKEDFESARHFYEKALKSGISKNVDIYHKQLGHLDRDEGNQRSAIQHYEASYRYEKDPVLLFYLARLYDDYYKDKSVAIRYYKRYVSTGHADQDYQHYAHQRALFLKNQEHMRN